MASTRGLVARSLLALDLLPWLGVTALIVAGRGNIEGWLTTVFRENVHRDAFERIDQALGLLWVVQSVHAFLAILAFVRRRSDVLVILPIGPTLVLVGIAMSQDWSDPDWLQAAGICTIGFLVGNVVAAGYWFTNWFPPLGSEKPRVRSQEL